VDLLVRDAIEAAYPGLSYRRDPSGETSRAAAAFQQSPELLRARAAVSRALKRLEERDLVIRVMAARSRWAGITLTPEGRRAASWYGSPDDPVTGKASTARRLQWRAARRQKQAEAEALIASFHREQDQQSKADIIRDTSDLADNVRDVAEPPDNIQTLPSEEQDFKPNNVLLDPCNAEEADSPLTPSNAHTDEADTNSPHTPALEPLKASCLDEACNLAHQLGWPKGIGSAIARQFGVSKQAVGQRKQKLVKG